MTEKLRVFYCGRVSPKATKESLRIIRHIVKEVNANDGVFINGYVLDPDNLAKFFEIVGGERYEITHSWELMDPSDCGLVDTTFPTFQAVTATYRMGYQQRKPILGLRLRVDDPRIGIPEVEQAIMREFPKPSRLILWKNPDEISAAITDFMKDVKDLGVQGKVIQQESSEPLECIPPHRRTMEIDWRSRTILRDGQEIHLTKIEYEILEYLAKKRTASRVDIVQTVWGSGEWDYKAILGYHISRLRRKIGEDGKNPGTLITIPGGYLLQVDDSSLPT